MTFTLVYVCLAFISGLVTFLSLCMVLFNSSSSDAACYGVLRFMIYGIIFIESCIMTMLSICINGL